MTNNAERALNGFCQLLLTFVYIVLILILRSIYLNFSSGNGLTTSSIGIVFAVVAPLIFVLFTGYFITASFIYVVIKSNMWYVRLMYSELLFLVHFLIMWLLSGLQAITFEVVVLGIFGFASVLAAEATTRWLWSLLPSRGKVG